jgi:hypothetical protein
MRHRSTISLKSTQKPDGFEMHACNPSYLVRGWLSKSMGPYLGLGLWHKWISTCPSSSLSPEKNKRGCKTNSFKLWRKFTWESREYVITSNSLAFKAPGKAPASFSQISHGTFHPIVSVYVLPSFFAYLLLVIHISIHYYFLRTLKPLTLSIVSTTSRARGFFLPCTIVKI